MSNTTINREKKGSAKWIETMVNEHQSELNKAIGILDIEWISPIKAKNNREYRFDQDEFLAELCSRDINLKKEFLFKNKLDNKNGFWPIDGGGGHWDAIGVAENKLILVEAKAHENESITRNIKKNPSAKSLVNDEIINQSFEKIMSDFKIDKSKTIGWLDKYYQIANRIAFWYFLNKLNIKTELIFIYFTNDFTNNCTSKDKYTKKYEKILQEMCLKSLFENQETIKTIYIDCNNYK